MNHGKPAPLERQDRAAQKDTCCSREGA